MFGKCWSKDQLMKHNASDPTSASPNRRENDDGSGCCPTQRVHQLWSYFYCIVLCLIQTLLVYRAALTIGENMSKPHLSAELYGYTVSVALSITISILAVVASVCRLGNFANDGDKLGKVIVRIQKNKPVEDRGASETSPNSNLPLWRRCWQRAAPFAPTCHLIAAFLLLIPRNFLLAKSLSQGNNADVATSTEIDIFMRRKTTRLDLYLLLTLTNVQSPELANTTWSQQTSHSFILGNDRPSSMSLPSAEWANYILSAIVFASRYPAVFWYTNKAIGILFVLHQLLTVVNYATSHAGFVLLFNLTYLTEIVPFDFLLHPVAVFLLYIFSLMVVLISSMIVFEYGYEQYLKQIRTYQRLVRRSSSASHHKLIVSANGNHHETEIAGSGHDSNTLMTMTSSYSWRTYCSNITAVIALICLTASKVPLVYDYMTIYRLSEDVIVFVCLISDAAYFFFWIVIWFIFTLKQNWTFLIQHPFIYFRDVAIDSTESNKTRSLLTMANGTLYQNRDASSMRHVPDNASAILANPQLRRHHNSASLMSRGSSPTRSLMDIAALTAPMTPAYAQQSRLTRPMSALVNPHIAHGLSSPSLPNCKAGYAGYADNSQPTASSTMHIYRQSMREKNTSHFYRGGTIGPQSQTNGVLACANDPKRRSLPAKHFSALNANQSSKLMNGSNQITAISESANERQSLSGWALTSSGPATDIIPEDAPVDSFRPHVPLKLSNSTTCYQLDGNVRIPNGSAAGLHESRSDFLLMSSAANNINHYLPSSAAATVTTASFASIPSIIKKRPAPPPRQSSAYMESVNSNIPSSSSPIEASTLTSSSASQV